MKQTIDKLQFNQIKEEVKKRAIGQYSKKAYRRNDPAN